MKRTDRQLLGKFNKDVLFLQKFITDTGCNSNVGVTTPSSPSPSPSPSPYP
jgi:hypothetical protein